MNSEHDVRANLRAFTRHYHLVKKAARWLKSDSVSVTLTADLESKSIRTEMGVSDHDMVRFVVLMRPLIVDSSGFCCRRTWRLLKSHFSTCLSKPAIAQIDEGFSRIEKTSSFAFEVNGERLTAGRVYELLGKGAFFIDESQIEPEVSRLLNDPLKGRQGKGQSVLPWP